MVSLIWYMMMMMTVCEKEVCLLCAGSGCVRFESEREWLEQRKLCLFSILGFLCT
ncbi:hypothetical protein RchiOBHm_Chr6g0263581 [Rosa chinensis]|uniref:Uncharacterized protein n=1 Tax=Rosa chinensis TaxID=74649 RepID=A0A2P6PNY8_ROSCH|nr:hypothetical protein RchiOBHm_Chr6g0263581 [Rosa chinensis]